MGSGGVSRCIDDSPVGLYPSQQPSASREHGQGLFHLTLPAPAVRERGFVSGVFPYQLVCASQIFTCTENADSDSVGRGLRLCIFRKFLRDSDAAGLRATLSSKADRAAPWPPAPFF